MTTRSQKRKAVAELVSGDFETSVNENSPFESLVASSSKVPRIKPEGLAEIKTSLRKEIMSDLTKILAENQKEVLKLIAPLNKKQTVHMNAQDSDSESENVSVARTSTPVKSHTATNSKRTPVNSRSSYQDLVKDTMIMQDRAKRTMFHHDLGKDAKISHDLDRGTMVNHDLARLTMILASLACLRSLGRKIKRQPVDKKLYSHLKNEAFRIPKSSDGRFLTSGMIIKFT